MPERLPQSRFLVLSAAVHAAALGVLGFALVTSSGPAPLGRVEAGLALPALLDDPIPALEETVDAAAPEATAPAAAPELVEAAEAGAEDPRFAEGAEGDAGAFPEAPAAAGIGGGGLRVRPRRAAVAAAPVPEPGPAPAAEAPPALPDVRARPLAGACAGPEFPARERRLGVEGVVQLLVRVAADGTVESAEVEVSSGVEAFDAAAVAAVLGWRFEPAVSAGVPVPDVVLQKVRFRLVSAAFNGR